MSESGEKVVIIIKAGDEDGLERVFVWAEKRGQI